MARPPAREHERVSIRMDSTELFLMFVERFVDGKRKPRWREIAHKKKLAHKNVNQLEGHLADGYAYVESPPEDLLAIFVRKQGPVWCWGMDEDPPVWLHAGQGDVGERRRRQYLATTTDGRKALFFNGDMGYFICGDWRL